MCSQHLLETLTWMELCNLDKYRTYMFAADMAEVLIQQAKSNPTMTTTVQQSLIPKKYGLELC